MPYIAPPRRSLYDPEIELLVEKLLSTMTKEPKKVNGDANYVITSIIAKVYANEDAGYDRLSDGDKTFVCAEREYYRRVMAPYEDKAELRNGDVY